MRSLLRSKLGLGLFGAGLLSAFAAGIGARHVKVLGADVVAKTAEEPGAVRTCRDQPTTMASLPANLVRDPNHPDYDPVVLREAGASMDEIFGREPRDSSWAQPMEVVVRNGVREDLAAGAPEASLTHVECRTTSCLLEIRAPLAQGERAFKALQFTVWGQRCNPRSQIRRTGVTVVHRTICVSPRKSRLDFLNPAYVEKVRLQKAARMGKDHPYWRQLRALGVQRQTR
jgi:hypothetical protein